VVEKKKSDDLSVKLKDLEKRTLPFAAAAGNPTAMKEYGLPVLRAVGEGAASSFEN